MRERNRHHERKGQGMLEGIVAIGIVVTAVAASLTLVQSSISGEKASELGIIGGNLAREGVEVVRAIRDSNWLSGDDWDTGLEAVGYDYTGVPILDPATAMWTIDFTPDTITDPDAALYRYVEDAGEATEGLYVHADPQPTAATTTLFRRLVTLDAICDDGDGSPGGYTIVESGSSCGTNRKIGIRVRSEVRWPFGDGMRDIEVEELMFDWY